MDYEDVVISTEDEARGYAERLFPGLFRDVAVTGTLLETAFITLIRRNGSASLAQALRVCENPGCLKEVVGDDPRLLWLLREYLLTPREIPDCRRACSRNGGSPNRTHRSRYLANPADHEHDMISTEDEARGYVARLVPEDTKGSSLHSDTARWLFEEVLLHLIRTRGAASPAEALASCRDLNEVQGALAGQNHRWLTETPNGLAILQATLATYFDMWRMRCRIAHQSSEDQDE